MDDKKIEINGTKICPRCEKEKILEEFSFKNKAKGIRHSHCKQCQRANKKKYWQRNKHRLNKLKRQYRAENYEKCLEQQQQWREANKEHVREWNRTYYTENKDAINKRRREHRKKHGEMIRKTQREYRRKNRERILRISQEWRYRNRVKVLEYHRRYYEKNKIQRCAESREYQKRRRRFSKYGITVDTFVKLADSQNNCCAVCNTPVGDIFEDLCIDHNHSTGKVRGLLCLKCNSALGMLKDSAEYASSAAAYLESHASDEPLPAPSQEDAAAVHP